MYPTIYYLLKDLFGIDFYLANAIQTFGFFVIVAFVISSYFFSKEMKRKEALGLLHAKKIIIQPDKPKNKIQEYGLNILIWFVFGFKFGGLLLNSKEYAENIRDYIFSMEGNTLLGLLAAAYGAYATYKELQKPGITKATEITKRPHEYVGNIVFLGGVFGIIGAKIFHLLENPNEIPHMLDSIDSFFSGLTMYGGYIVASFATLYYAKKQGFNIIHVIDAAAPAMLLGYGLGRIGCQMAGDGDWGIDNLAAMPDMLRFLPDWMWSFSYPHNVIKQGIPMENCEGPYCFMLPNPVFPTPFYECVMILVAFAFLWAFRKRITTPGVMTCIYLMITGFERFWIEKIRVNSVYHIFGHDITQAEIISTILFFLGLFGVIYLKKKQKNLNPSTV